MNTSTVRITHSSIGKIMMNNLPRFLICTALPSVAAAAFALANVTAQATAPTLATAQQKLSAMSVPFVPNGGQWDSRAAFATQTFAGTLFVTTEGQLVYSLPGKRVADGATDLAPSPAARERVGVRAADKQTHRQTQHTPGWVLTETLVDANGQPRKLTTTAQKKPLGELPTEGKVSYGIGDDPAKHASELPSYERINLGEMSPGVNVHLRATGSNVEKIFTVAPQQDPKQIRIKLEGAEKLEIGSQGELIAHTGNGPVSFTKPIAFQDIEGVRLDVSAQYALNAHTQEYGFTLGNFNKAWPIVIDPLLQSTYHGGSGIDRATAMAIHPATGEVYIAGYTDSPDLPGVTTANGGVATGAQSAITGGSGIDAFVARFNATLTRRMQSTFLGGSETDEAAALAFHPTTGEVYIAGYTESADLPGVSPTSGGVAIGAQSTKGGVFDAFVSRFNPELTVSTQSTYFGGSLADGAYSLAIHPVTEEIYIAGYTVSTNLPSVTTGSGGVSTGAQSGSGGSTDAFVARFNAGLTTRLQATYHGGSGLDLAYALAIHPTTGEVYVAGRANSANLPGVTTDSGGVATGAQPINGGGTADAFVARFNATLTARPQSTYFGGSGIDEARALAIHPATGEVYIAGDTASTNLPSVTTDSGGLATGAQPNNGGGTTDAFVARFNAALTTRPQSTYLGGSSTDEAFALAIYPATGEVYVAGSTASNNLPSVNPAGGGVSTGAQSVKSTGDDAFVARLNAALTTRAQSSYLGGTRNEQANALAIHPATGEVYLAGYTNSTDLPGVTSASGGVTNGAQSGIAVALDAFVSRLSPDLTNVNRIPNPFSFIHQSNVPPNTIRTSNEVRLIIEPNPGNNQQSAYVTGAPGSELCVANQPGICVTPYVACAPPCYATNWFVGPWDFVSGDYIAVRHMSANPSGTAETKLLISGTAYPFRSSTGNANIACNLDMNGNNTLAGTMEGLILLRAMLGFDSAATIAGTGISEAQWNLMRPTINQNCGTNF
jgi:hypothetical protein